MISPSACVCACTSSPRSATASTTACRWPKRSKGPGGRLFQCRCRLVLELLDGDPARGRARRNVPLAQRRLQEAERLPVVAFGRIARPALAEEMLVRGDADLIGFARQLIADPETPNKLRSGRAHLVRPCIACNDACMYQVGQEKADPLRPQSRRPAGRTRSASAFCPRSRCRATWSWWAAARSG